MHAGRVASSLLILCSLLSKTARARQAEHRHQRYQSSVPTAESILPHRNRSDAATMDESESGDDDARDRWWSGDSGSGDGSGDGDNVEDYDDHGFDEDYIDELIGAGGFQTDQQSHWWSFDDGMRSQY